MILECKEQERCCIGSQDQNSLDGIGLNEIVTDEKDQCD
jgi:hypothetical protein